MWDHGGVAMHDLNCSVLLQLYCLLLSKLRARSSEDQRKHKVVKKQNSNMSITSEKNMILWLFCFEVKTKSTVMVIIWHQLCSNIPVCYWNKSFYRGWKWIMHTQIHTINKGDLNIWKCYTFYLYLFITRQVPVLFSHYFLKSFHPSIHLPPLIWGRFAGAAA